MPLRGLLVVLVAVLAACGSTSHEAGDGSGIRAVDRPAPDAYERWTHPDEPIEIVVSSEWCLPLVGNQEAKADCDESRTNTWDRCKDDAEKARTDPVCREYHSHLQEARKMHERWLAEVAPAQDAEPRVVAELSLRDGQAVELVVWRTERDQLCGLARALGIADWAQQLVGECAPDPWSCEVICPSMLVAAEKRIFLVGMVTETAEALQVTTLRGETLLVPLDGVAIPHSSLQALLVDLGDDGWRKLEVLRDGRVLDTIDMGSAEDNNAVLCEIGESEEECEEREAELDE